jgi:hypothetical protein
MINLSYVALGLGAATSGRALDLGDGMCCDMLDVLASRLAVLRRADDVIGGLDLAWRVDQMLRGAIQVLGRIGSGVQRRRALQLVAGHAQLAGWVHADAGDYTSARRAYQVALHAAAIGEDRELAAYVLGSLSHQSLASGSPEEALLLARTGLAGVRGNGSAMGWVLLLHRVALAAASGGNRREAEAALVGAERAADRSEPGQEPEWLYWLDDAELSAMTGRCLSILGRPLRAVQLLAEPRTATGPRTAALYGAWLARSYVELGEVEQACRVAGRALSAAVSAGSVRAAEAVRRLRPLLLRHRGVPAVREYEQQAEQAAIHLPVS